ncbi:MAG: type II toxin-antitoxin system RelE/ParE family toxin, partial [Candidatus Thermoplasmatota archaeon]|nr:type II toxin-antitoxin system RelE/ParE family toxin [Candidatus Thermoplasmatota archaeon]
MTELRFTIAAKDQLAKLDRNIRIRIYQKLEETIDWPAHYLKPLVAYPYFRLRIGDYRVIIDLYEYP